jgi:hypothetical protein
MNDVLTFITIVQIYQVEGMVALGKMKHPVTNELMKNQDHARYVIDMLAILKEKTTGNLNIDEARILEQTISTLKLNFVDEFGNPDAPASAGNLA